MKRKRLIIICMLLMGISISSAFSQVILDKEHNLPKIGDQLSKVPLTDIDYSAKVIDLREKILEDTPLTVEYFSEDEENDSCLSKIDEGTIYHYLFSSNQIYLLGYENQMVKVSFSMPQVVIGYPLLLHDSIRSEFEGEGMYADKIPMLYNGYRIVGNTTEHTLVMPDGENIKCVYTIHSLNHISLFPKINDKNAFPAIIEKECWDTYAKGYRYPIMETVLYRKNDSILSSKSFFYPLDKQSYLLQDYANNVNQQSRETLKNESSQKETSVKPYTFSYSQDFHEATVKYNTDQDCDIKLVLASTTGICYYNKESLLSANEEKKISFNCSRLPMGQYALYMNIDGKQLVEKFNIK